MKSTPAVWEVWEFKKSGAERMNPDIPEKLSPRFSPGAGYGTAEQYVREASARLIQNDESVREFTFRANCLNEEIFIVADYGESAFHFQVRKCREKVYPFYHWEIKEHEKFFETHSSFHAMD